MTVFRLLVFVLVALVSTVYAQTQDNGSASTYMGLRGGATFTIHTSNDLYYPQSNDWVGGLSLETDLGPNGSKTWAFMLNASYGTYRLATVLQGDCLGCLGGETQYSVVTEEYETISQVDVSPLLALRIGSTGFEVLGGISAGYITGVSTLTITKLSDSMAAEARTYCPDCEWIDDNTVVTTRMDINTSSGVKFALLGGLQYVLRIASTEIVPAVLYRYGLSASTDVNNTMLRAIDATISLRVPL